MRSARVFSRREVIGTSLGMLLLQACSRGAGAIGGLLPQSGAARTARGTVTRTATAQFPAARPVRTLSTGSTTSLTYESFTAVIDDANCYAEIYDPSGNLIGQLQWSVDANGVLTAIAIGPTETATATMPTAQTVADAGSVTLGTATCTLETSGTSLADSGAAVWSNTVAPSGTMTLTPANSQLSTLATYWRTLPPLPIGCGSHGCPQGLQQPQNGVNNDCREAMLAALAILIVAAYVASEVLGPCAIPEPAEPAYCAIAGIVAGWILSNAAATYNEVLAEGCAQ